MNMKTEDMNKEQRSKRLADFHELMKRYLAGERLTAEEMRRLDAVASKAAGNPDESTDGLKPAVWEALSREMAKTRRRTVLFAIRRYAAAAVVTLLVGVGALIAYQSGQAGSTPQEVIIAAADGVKTVTLPDGSRVHLNRGTTLAYDKSTFNADRREVRLDGEAFFEVTKNPRKPFLVQGSEVLTTVRGTSFNVKAYAALRENVVSVRDGRVEVSNRNRKLLATLVHNQQLTWNADTRRAVRDSIDWQDAAGWKDGAELLFNSAGLDEISLKARQYYGISLAVDGIRDMPIRLCGTYPLNDHGEALLRQLSDIYGITARTDANRTVTLSRAAR